MRKMVKRTLMAAALTLGLSGFSGVAEASNFKDTGSAFVFDHNNDKKYDYHLKTNYYGNINKHVYAVSKYLMGTKGNFTDVTYVNATKIVPNARVVVSYSKTKAGLITGDDAFSIAFYEKTTQDREFLSLILNNVSWDGSTYFDKEYQVALRESIYKVFGSKAGYPIYANLYYMVIDAKKGKLKDGDYSKKISGYEIDVTNYNSTLYISIKF